MSEKKQAMAIANEGALVSASDTMVERIIMAASDPNVDVEKFERMMAMAERMQAKKAEAEFNEAFSRMQPELPEILEGGQIRHGGNLISTYARWDEDINPVIKPILAAHGFSLYFRIDTSDGVIVTGILGHRAGHREETTMKLPPDNSGAKNPVQALGSSVAYGKRYTGGALLNLSSYGADDDGNAAAGNPKVSEEQIANLECLITETGADLAKFLKYMGAESLDRIQASQYPKAIQALEAKRRA